MFWRRGRFGDLVGRQLALFLADNDALLVRIDEAKEAYEHAGAEDAEERFGDYMDLVESMAARDRRVYEREFYRAAEKQLPSLAARRHYRRAIDPDTYA
jgi:hypothetical protein